tara:strand:- start:46 stop:291 length:246 start_codon:yes stop_codon:yes gene_type:complete
MKIEKNIPIPERPKSIASMTACKMEVGDSVYFEGVHLNNSKVIALVNELKKIGKATKRQIYDFDMNSKRRSIIGVRVWRTE